MTVRSGHCSGGPKNGQLLVTQSKGNVPAEGGFYVHTPAAGTTPSGWRFIESKGPKR